jgi:phospholipid/cholesterol/gamma-HCH transport system substrate-binding protein
MKAEVRETVIGTAFYKVGGLAKGSDVRISGIKMGTVQNLRLDSRTYNAVVTMTIMPKVKILVDSVASISSEGIPGGKYIRLEPGTEKTYLADGASLKKTKDFRSLEDQVGKIIFLATGGNKGG